MENTVIDSKKLVKQVIIVRKDLKMRRGKEMAQASHASMEFLLQSFRDNPGVVVGKLLTEEEEAWFHSGTKKIVVGCDSEEEILTLYAKAKAAGLEAHLITDHGYTEFHGKPTITCLAIGPHYPEKIDPLTSYLKLL
jgi:PTH2 family peptidyl-tRNA hydrolase